MKLLGWYNNIKNDRWNANAKGDSIEVSILPHVYASNAYAVIFRIMKSLFN